MNLVFYATLFVVAFLVMFRYGAGRTFAYVFLPCTLLVNFAVVRPMPGIPNLATTTVMGFGVIAALVLKPAELRKIRWNALDTIVTVLPLSIFITTTLTIDAWNGYRETFEYGLRWVFPYFLARMALQDADGRRAALKVLCCITPVIGLCAAIECTRSPNFVARMLKPLQMDSISNVEVLKRFGLARALVTAGQPIDLGCLGVLTGTFILILIPATGTTWRKPLTVAGILGAGAMVFGSVSMTAWVGFAVAGASYVVVSRPGVGKYLVVPLLLTAILGMSAVTYRLLHDEISVDRPEDEIAASKWIRVRIMQDAWEQASTAGLFGHGKDLDTKSIGVGSVDNSYLLFLMQTGWFMMGLWLLLAFTAAVMLSRTLGRAMTASERFPVAAAAGGFLGILVAMYTVYFGFAYAIMFAALLGMIGTMSQMMAARRVGAVSLAGGYLPQGFPVIAR